MTPLVFLDTETDGVHPNRRVWEVAMIRRDDDGQRERSFFVGVPPLCAHDAAKEVMSWTFGAHLVGAVPNFDAEALARLLRAEGYLPSWHYHLIDVEAMAVGWLFGTYPNGAALVGEPPWKSDDLARACGVEPPTDDERHTALGDTRWAMRWYDAMTGGAQ